MTARILWLLKRAGAVLAIALVMFLGLRIWDSQRGLPLEPWHTFVPHELDAEELDRVGWPEYLAAEQRIFEEVRSRGHPEADGRGAGSGQPLLRGQPGLSRPFRRRLEPLARARARRTARGCGCAAAWAHGRAVQPAAYRRVLPRARLCRDHPTPAGPRHRAGGTHQDRLGGLGGGDAARGPRGPPTHRARQAPASRRLLERRRAGDAICAGRDRESRTRRAPTGWC